MNLEMAAMVVFVIAHSALERFFFRVDHHVPVQIPAGAARQSARGALKKFLPCAYS